MIIRKIIGLCICFTAGFAYAQSALDVVTTYKNLPCPPFSTATIQFDTVEESGTVSERREVKQYGKIFKNNEINTVFEFTSPASIKNMRILKAEKIGRNDDNVVYLPELRQVRRVPMSERNTSIVGTELTYQDLRIREIDDDKHEMVDENASTTVGDVTYKAWKIKSTPVKRSEVDYSYRLTWFDKDTYLPVRVEYYDKKTKTKLNKTFTIEKIDHVKGITGNDYVLRRLCWVKNEDTGRKTRIYVKDFVFDAKLTEAYFTQSWLQTGKAR